MNPHRRRWLAQLATAAALAGGGQRGATAAAAAAAPPAPGAGEDGVRRGRVLVFPRDHGAHIGTRTEWWYATGWLSKPGPAGNAAQPPNPAAAPVMGFQVTFFRSRTGLAQALRGRFAPRQLLCAHAAVTDLETPRHWHDQRIVRWSEAPDAATGRAALADADIHIGDWSLRREPPASAIGGTGAEPQAEAGAGTGAPGRAAVAGASRWRARVPARDFRLDLTLDTTQPLLLQGDAGFSRKGPHERQASHYYSEPQLALGGSMALSGSVRQAAGRAWIDHEWSDDLLHPEAVGWDWIGMNLFDGSALTAFVLRRGDGTALWAGGSFRAAGAQPRRFGPEELAWRAGRTWRSPASSAIYPVAWQLQTPAGAFGVRALLDAQELDSRNSTGSIYWEGLSELLNAGGQRVGLGYLEMTGYAGRLRLG